MSLFLKWLSFQKTKKVPPPPRSHLALLHLEERNSASALAGLEGMVLFGATLNLGKGQVGRAPHETTLAILRADAPDLDTPKNDDERFLDSFGMEATGPTRLDRAHAWETRTDSEPKTDPLDPLPQADLVFTLANPSSPLAHGPLNQDFAGAESPDFGWDTLVFPDGSAGFGDRLSNATPGSAQVGSTDLIGPPAGTGSIDGLFAAFGGSFGWVTQTSGNFAPGPLQDLAQGDSGFSAQSWSGPSIDQIFDPSSGQDSWSAQGHIPSFGTSSGWDLKGWGATDPSLVGSGQSAAIGWPSNGSFPFGGGAGTESGAVSLPGLGGESSQGGLGILRLDPAPGKIDPGSSMVGPGGGIGTTASPHDGASSLGSAGLSASTGGKSGTAQVTISPAATSMTAAGSTLAGNTTESGALRSQTVLFRAQRVTQESGPLTLRITMNAFDAARMHTLERNLTLAAGQRELDIAAGQEWEGLRPTVVTLRAQAPSSGLVATPVATRLLTVEGSAPSDGALLEAYRQGGSQEAFDTLVRQYWQGVFRTCHRILGQWTDAEDVSQFVFLALTQLNTRFPNQVSHWLRRVARNAAIGVLRSKKRREKREQSSSRADRVESHEFALERTDLVDFALDQLPNPLREAVSLRYLEGWSQQEAADRVGCPRGTLSQRSAHGLEKLRGILSRQTA